MRKMPVARGNGTTIGVVFSWLRPMPFWKRALIHIDLYEPAMTDTPAGGWGVLYRVVTTALAYNASEAGYFGTQYAQVNAHQPNRLFLLPQTHWGHIVGMTMDAQCVTAFYEADIAYSFNSSPVPQGAGMGLEDEFGYAHRFFHATPNAFVGHVSRLTTTSPVGATRLHMPTTSSARGRSTPGPLWTSNSLNGKAAASAAEAPFQQQLAGCRGPRSGGFSTTTVGRPRPARAP